MRILKAVSDYKMATMSFLIFSLTCIQCQPDPAILKDNKPNIYGLAVNLNGGGGIQIIDVNFDTGVEDNPRNLSITTSVFGIARKFTQAAGQNEGTVTALEPASGACGSGTAFYNVDLNTGQSVKLGVAQGYAFISCIEYNPIDDKLYGIYNNTLVRVDNLGACSPGTNGTPAQITELGNIGNTGAGPYSVYFDHLGTCFIISAKDHLRSIVEIPLSPTPGSNLKTIGPIMVDASWTAPSTMNGTLVAACMSGITEIVGTSYTDATPYATKSFYHIGNPSWALKGSPSPFQALDFTSTPSPK